MHRWLIPGIVWALTVGIPAGKGQAAETLTVGSGQDFSRVEEALTQAQPGDTILVHPLPDGQAYARTALLVNTPRITLRAVHPGPPVVLSGKGYDYSGRGRIPRAIVQFNPEASGCTLEGFELTGAHNQSHNGAGVRINQANGVTVRNCHIHHNDMGVMSNGNGRPDTGRDQLFTSCLIHENGNFSHPGYNHNLYLGGTGVTLRGCEVYGSLTGHNVKSRAHLTRLLACWIHDAANRELDLVDARGDTDRPGSDAIVAGCVITKDPDCPGNRSVIHFGQDGGKGHTGTLYLAHNTIQSPFISPVVDLSTPGAHVHLANNLIWDGGASQHNQVLVHRRHQASTVNGTVNAITGGWKPLEDAGSRVPLPKTTGLPFANPAVGDLRLTCAVPELTGRGRPLPAVLTDHPGFELLIYRPPQRVIPRPTRARPTLGAGTVRTEP